LLLSPDLAPVQKRLRTFSAQFHDFQPVRAQIATPDDGRFASWCGSCAKARRSLGIGTSGRNSKEQDQFGRRNCVNARWCRSLGHFGRRRPIRTIPNRWRATST
jgi:hypothetical protein